MKSENKKELKSYIDMINEGMVMVQEVAEYHYGDFWSSPLQGVPHGVFLGEEYNEGEWNNVDNPIVVMAKGLTLAKTGWGGLFMHINSMEDVDDKSNI